MRRSSARSQRRELRHGISAFPAVLGSAHPGIRFTAVITARVVTQPPVPYDPQALADRIRLALRAAAADAVRRMDPCDLPAAQDACTRSLRASRRIGDDTPVEVKAEARLTLGPEDDKAVHALLDASRSQAIKETLNSQRLRALAAQLVHPAGVFAWWLQRPEANLSAQPDDEALRQAAERMRSYPSGHDEPLEIQLLEVLRDFLSTFTRDEQKRMLLSLLADGMRAARQPGHAHAVEALASTEGLSGPAAFEAT